MRFLLIILISLYCCSAYGQPKNSNYQKDNAQYHFNYAKILEQEGSIDLALLSIKEALSYDSTDPNILYMASHIYTQIGDRENALLYEKLALINFEKGHYFKLSPYYLYHDYGVSNLEKEKYQVAYYCFNEALRYKATAIGVFNRGNCKLYLEDVEGACKDWKIAKYNGIPYAQKLMDTYCTDSEEDTVVYTLRSDSTTFIDNYAPGKDTLTVAIYYSKDWYITHKRSSNYRIGGWIVSQQRFEGPFTDYIETNKIAEGSYQDGKLNGAYRGYYRNGNLMYTGFFVDGRPTGTWLFYYYNKHPWLVIHFEDENYEVLQCQDIDGNYTLVNGEGSWTYRGILGYECNGQYKHFKRRGEWSVKRPIVAYGYFEKYNRKGKLKSAGFKNGWGKADPSIKPDFAKILTGIWNDKINSFYLESNEATDKYSFLHFKKALQNE